MSKLDNFFRNLAYDLEWNYDDPNINTDHPECPKCGAKMDFFGRDENGVDFLPGDAYWECSNCSFKFNEEKIREYNVKDF